jgi:hypothetical protein
MYRADMFYIFMQESPTMLEMTSAQSTNKNKYANIYIESNNTNFMYSFSGYD